MSNFLVAVAVFMITVLAALFAIPYFVDWNGYRGVFEEEASRLLGREVRVGGAVNLHLLPTPYFRFEKVRIADASINLQEPFFRTESVTIKLSVPPLLRGAVEANEIELRRPVLRLAVDDKDRWNWQSFAQALANASYLPSNVVLTSLKVTDGVLALHGPDGAERTRFEALNADISAPALDGPYRLRGSYGRPGAERDIRINTARPEADGSVRLKGFLRASDSGFSYTLEARLIDLMAKPRVEGEFNAHLPFAKLWPTQARAKTAPTGTAGANAEAAFELKAQLKADAAGLALSDLSLSFEQDGRPQIITGDLKAGWRNALTVEISLASRWLDLDRLAGVGEGGLPLDSALPFVHRIQDLLPADGRSRAKLAVDQANVGREALSGLRLSMVRNGDQIEIEELRAGLPGGARAELSGRITGATREPVFTGNLALRGNSLARFASWASGGAIGADARHDGAFGLRTQLSIEPGKASLRNMAGDVSGTALYGSGTYRWEGTREVALELEGPQLDVRALVPAGAGLGDIMGLIVHGSAAVQGSPGKSTVAKSGQAQTQTDVLVRVSTGQLLTATGSYRDVTLEIELKRGTLRVPLLRVAGDDGLTLELEGEVADAATHPKGSLRATASADNGRAVLKLADLIGVPESLRPREERLNALTPLRLAGSMGFGAGQQNSLDLTVAGEANGGPLNLSGRFDGGPAGWRSGPADVTLSIENPDATQIAGLLAPGGASVTRSETQQPGRILVKAGGVPSDGMVTIASLEAGETLATFRGRVVSAESGQTIAGDIAIKGADGTRLAALAGLSPPLQPGGGLPISGTMRLTSGGGKLDVERMALRIAGVDVRGRLSLSPDGAKRNVTARLDVDTLSTGDLLGPLLDQRLGAVTAAAESVLAGRTSVWPDQPFDAAVLEGFSGAVTLTAGRLLLAEGVGLEGVRLEIALGEAKVEIRQLEGRALKGRWQGSATLERLPNGAELRGTLSVAGAELAPAAASTRAAGTFEGSVSFSGRGKSPRALFAALQGKGALKFTDASISALWPGAMATAVDAGLNAEGDKISVAIRQALLSSLSGGSLPLPGEVGLEIADGQLRAKNIAGETPEGTAVGSAALDLSALTLASEWRLARKPRVDGERPLPPATLTYRGPITALGRLEPTLSTEALERELAVRKVERDVEELERLRRLDEARRRTDTERLRLQLERAPPPPTAPPPPPPTGPRVLAPQGQGGPRPASPGG